MVRDGGMSSVTSISASLASLLSLLCIQAVKSQGCPTHPTPIFILILYNLHTTHEYIPVLYVTFGGVFAFSNGT